MKVNENNRPNLFLRLLFLVNLLAIALIIGAYLSTHISPESFIYFAFLGLSFPVWLALNLGFVIFWIFFKRKWALYSLITLILGFNHIRHFVAFTFVQPELENPIKVMSYNVKIFNLYDVENRKNIRNAIFRFLQEENPDVICFQEFYHHEGGKQFVTKDTMLQLLETKYYHERYTHDLSDKRYFGVATFSKYPIINKGEIPFENDKNNFCIYSDMVINGDTVRVFNAHLGSIRFQQDDYRVFDETAGEDRYIDTKDEVRILTRLKQAFLKRASQAETVAAQVKESPYPVVLCGDFNDTPVSYCYRQFISLLNDAFVESGNGIGSTYIGEMPSNRIDYIFHSPEIISSMFTTHDIHYSDHKPVSCLVEVVK